MENKNFKIMDLLVTPIRRLNHIKRFSFVPCVRVENVAEHSYFVTLYALYLARYWISKGINIDVLRLMEASVLHDVEESMTGDIIRSFKYFNPVLKKEIDKAAMEMLSSVFKDTESNIKEHFIQRIEKAKDETIEGRILAFCDLVSVYAYCLEEIRIWNKNMVDVFKEAQSYVYVFKDICDGFFNPFVEEIEAIDPETFNHSYYNFVPLNK